MQIIIVDDESITRQWMRKKIEEIDIDYHIIGEFSNGRQALEFCQNQKVDVVITDIRMAVMDGLEFLEKLKELEIQPYKIILSAYDEFHYARQAMKLGVQEFLLKPEVTKEEIRQILEGAKTYLQKKREEQQKCIQEQSYTKEKYLLRFLKEGVFSGEEEIQSTFNEQNILLSNKSLVVSAFSVCSVTESEQVREVVNLFMEAEQNVGYCIEEGNREYLLLYNQNLHRTRREVQEEMFHILYTHFGNQVYVGVSRQANGFSRLMDLYRQAEAARDNRIFFQSSGIQLYEDMQVYTEAGELVYRKEMDEIRRRLEKQDIDGVEKLLKNFLEMIRKNTELYPAYIRALCMEILSLYIQHTKQYALNPEEKKVLQNIELAFGTKFITYEELQRFMEDAYEKIAEILKNKWIICQYSAPVQEIVEYVAVHYEEKISLETIAEKVHLNRTYISSVFKKETGEKFSDYLQRIRLEAACNLIQRDSRMTLQTIAEQTGFCDAAHLSRVFKERYDISPVEFRRRERNSIQKS